MTGNSSGKTYHLLTFEDTSSASAMDDTSKLSALITAVSLKEQQIERSPHPTSSDQSDWWYCSWTTGAADFKSRKFKCTGVEYNKDNGYIEKISFLQVK